MVNVSDVIYTIVNNFNNCVPKSNHYLGYIPEQISRPAFLYTIVYLKNRRDNFFLQNITLDMQIIYFGKIDEFGRDNYEDKLNAMGMLGQFLNQFNLHVKDRNLKFDYSFGAADDQLTIDMQFNFKDDVLNLTYDEEQTRQMIEKININKEVIS